MVRAFAVTIGLIAAGVAGAVALDARPAEARGFVSVGIGVPLFPPYYAYPPPPVVYAPPVMYAAPPVVVSQPQQYWCYSATTRRAITRGSGMPDAMASRRGAAALAAGQIEGVKLVKRIRTGVAVLTAAGLLAGCAQPPLGPTVRVVPAANKPFPVFQKEDFAGRWRTSRWRAPPRPPTTRKSAPPSSAPCSAPDWPRRSAVAAAPRWAPARVRWAAPSSARTKPSAALLLGAAALRHVLLAVHVFLRRPGPGTGALLHRRPIRRRRPPPPVFAPPPASGLPPQLARSLPMHRPVAGAALALALVCTAACAPPPPPAPPPQPQPTSLPRDVLAVLQRRSGCEMLMRAHDPRNDLAITHSRCDSVAAEEQALRRHYGAGSPEAAALDSRTGKKSSRACPLSSPFRRADRPATRQHPPPLEGEGWGGGWGALARRQLLRCAEPVPATPPP